jgi:hypothetical protein
VVWVAALLVLVLLLLGWIANSSWVWLRTTAARPARAVSTAGLVVAAGVLTIVLGTYFTLREVSEAIAFSKLLTAQQHEQVSEVTWAGPRWLWQLVMDPQTIFILSKPIVPLAILLLWAFPLAVALVRRRRTGEAAWAFLDPGGRIDAERPRVSLVRPLAIGACGGSACIVAYVLYRAGIHAWVALDTRYEDAFLLAFVFWQVVLALAAQGVAGAVAAALARDAARLAEGLCAATVTGTIAVLAIVVGPVVGGCADPVSVRAGPCRWDVSAQFTWNLWRQVITEGAVAAVVAGLLVVGALALRRAIAGAALGRTTAARSTASHG